MADELRSGRGDIDAATRLRAALAAVQARIVEAEVAAMRLVYEAACRYGRLRQRIAAGEPIQGLARRTRDARIDLLEIAAALAGEGE